MPAINTTQASYLSSTGFTDNQNKSVPGQKEGLATSTPTTLWKQHSAYKHLSRESVTEADTYQSIKQKKIECYTELSDSGSLIDTSRLLDDTGAEVVNRGSPSSSMNEKYENISPTVNTLPKESVTLPAVKVPRETTISNEIDGSTLEPYENLMSTEDSRINDKGKKLVDKFISRLNTLTENFQDKLHADIESMDPSIDKKVYEDKFEKFFVDYHDKLLNMLNKRIKKVDNNPTLYGDPDSIKMRLWCPCQRVVDDLNDPYIPDLQRIHNLTIRTLDNTCEQELKKLADKIEGVHPRQPCKIAESATNESTDPEYSFQALKTKLNAELNDADNIIEVEMSQVRAEFSRIGKMLDKVSGTNQFNMIRDFLYDASYESYIEMFSKTRNTINNLRSSEKKAIDNMAGGTNYPPDSESTRISPEAIEAYKAEADRLVDEAIVSLNTRVEAGYGKKDRARYNSIYSRLRYYESNGGVPLFGAAAGREHKEPVVDLGAVTSGASRPRNILSDVASLLLRGTDQPLRSLVHRIHGTEQDISSLSLPYQQPDVTVETSCSIKKEPALLSSVQVSNTPQINPDLVFMPGASQPGKTPMLIGADQNISVNGINSSSLQITSMVAAKLSGQDRIVPKVTPPLSPPDPESAIHNNPASNLLANSVAVMTVVLLSKMFKDMISPGQKQSLDASLTPKNILDIATVQEYCSHQGQPESLPSGFIDAVFNSPEVGIDSASDNFEVNRSGELAIKEGKPERVYRSILLDSLAKDYRKSSMPASTDNARNDVSDKALAEQIHKQLPDATSDDRAIIYRAIMLKDQQQTTWTESFIGSSWPSDREEQIKTMQSLLNPAAQSRERKSAAEVESEGKSSIPVADPVVQHLSGNNIAEGQGAFLKFSPAEMLSAIDQLRAQPDICRFDQSEAVYQEVKKGLAGLLTGRQRKEYILQETSGLCKKMGLPETACSVAKLNDKIENLEQRLASLEKRKSHLERHNIKKNQQELSQIREEVALMKKTRQAIQVKNTVASRLANHTAALKQQAWELMAYQYDIKIGVTQELKSLAELQLRLIKEKLADTPDEALVLSQIIPEMPGPGALTCYEKSQRQDGLRNKLPIPYQRLCYTGPELEKTLAQYCQIKAIASMRYLAIFGEDDVVETSREDIISSASQQCLIRQQQNKSEWSQQKLVKAIDHLLQHEKGKEANIHSVKSGQRSDFLA